MFPKQHLLVMHDRLHAPYVVDWSNVYTELGIKKILHLLSGCSSRSSWIEDISICNRDASSPYSPLSHILCANDGNQFTFSYKPSVIYPHALITWVRVHCIPNKFKFCAHDGSRHTHAKGYVTHLPLCSSRDPSYRIPIEKPGPLTVDAMR